MWNVLHNTGPGPCPGPGSGPSQCEYTINEIQPVTEIRTDIFFVLENRTLLQMGPQSIQPDKWAQRRAEIIDGNIELYFVTCERPSIE